MSVTHASLAALKADASLGCIILNKSSSASPSDKNHTEFTLAHAHYAHKLSERVHFVLKAGTPELRDAWVHAINMEILAARVPPVLTGARLSPVPGSGNAAAACSNHTMQAFADMPCNAACADCGATAPRWASVTHQVLICVECAGVHR